MQYPRSESLRIVHYCAPRIVDPRAEKNVLKWQDYQTARNQIVEVCRRHGSVGPLGTCVINESEDGPADWERGDEEPAYYVIDDQYNHERYIYIELESSSSVTKAWLEDILTVLVSMPYWGVGVTNVANGFVLIFQNMLLVAGNQFVRQDIDDVLEQLRRTLVV